MNKGVDMPSYLRLVSTSPAQKGEVVLTFEVIRWRLVLHLAGELLRFARANGAPVWHPVLWWTFIRGVFGLWGRP